MELVERGAAEAPALGLKLEAGRACRLLPPRPPLRRSPWAAGGTGPREPIVAIARCLVAIPIAARPFMAQTSTFHCCGQMPVWRRRSEDLRGIASRRARQGGQGRGLSGAAARRPEGGGAGGDRPEPADSVSIEVHEESANSAHLVLPPSGRLADGDLERIAAGDVYNHPYHGRMEHQHPDGQGGWGPSHS